MLSQTCPSVDVQIEIQKALKAYFDAFDRLRDLSVTPNSRAFTCQIGEWLVAQMYDGERATSGIQKGWDVRLKSNVRVQVKSHAKASTTEARWSNINCDPHAETDELAILRFSQQYQLLEFYRAPWDQVLLLIRRHADKDRIFWDDLKDFKIELNDLPNQEVLKPFR